MFKKGNLLAYKPAKSGGLGFVVLVTKEKKSDPNHFKGIVVASKYNHHWEVGEKDECWIKESHHWEVVDFPDELY